MWLDQHKPIQQTLWSPAEPRIIKDKHLLDGGWFPKGNVTAFNLYLGPRRMPAGRVDHRPWRTVPVGAGRTVARFLKFGPGEHEVKVRYRGEGVVRSVRSGTTVRVKN